MGRSPSYFEKARGNSSNQVAFTLLPKAHAGIDLVFEIHNIISGSVYDPMGRPMYDVCATLVPTNAKSSRESSGGHGCTDMNGRFEITSISPGSYVLILNEFGQKSSSQPFDMLYYPGVSEREKARVITTGAGGSLKNLKIVVPAVDETVTLKGVLRYSDGKPVAHEWVEFKAIRTPGFDGSITTKTDSKGRFLLKVLKGLKGELESDFSASSDQYESCRKVLSLMKTSGPSHALVKATMRIEADHDLRNLTLRFPFPSCSRIRRR